MAENYVSTTPYGYVGGNPVIFYDILGLVFGDPAKGAADNHSSGSYSDDYDWGADVENALAEMALWGIQNGGGGVNISGGSGGTFFADHTYGRQGGGSAGGRYSSAVPGDPPGKKAFRKEDYSVEKLNVLPTVVVMPTPKSVSRGIRFAIIPVIGVYTEIGFAKSKNSKWFGKPYISLGWGFGVEFGISYTSTLFSPIGKGIVEVEEMEGWENSQNIAISMISYSWGSNYKNWDNYRNKHPDKLYETEAFGIGFGEDIGYSFTKGYTWILFKNW